jgi:hypothetical protein
MVSRQERNAGDVAVSLCLPCLLLLYMALLALLLAVFV